MSKALHFQVLYLGSVIFLFILKSKPGHSKGSKKLKEYLRLFFKIKKIKILIRKLGPLDCL